MAEILPYEEIKSRYNGEWVLIAYQDLDENFQVVTGEVLAHSQDVDQVYAAIPLAQGREAAVEFVGQVSEEFATLL